MRRESPEVSGRIREYSRFEENSSGDGFDRDCRQDLALCLGPFFCRLRRVGIGRPGLPARRPAVESEISRSRCSPVAPSRPIPNCRNGGGHDAIAPPVNVR